ncbi:YceI family protein [Undibacterium pigrum]|uniref:Polyisoprenoid-binding protein YceI n=1 Tax=Undibacterium pigrum TaxID=401470 RepID=A0A318J5C8_9BURK|nr:YceI family protein [Undibacterium pigrum]PXX41902.1 polyisoprenoid-binding protein YceI [Undibacterium pigrum]
MLRNCLLLLLAACSLTATAADKYLVDQEHTFSNFEYKHWGLSLQRGRFDKNSGSIELDMENKTGSLQIAIEAESINTGSDTFNKILRSPSFFNIEKYPKITFQSNKMVFNEDKLVQVEGDLTIKDVTRKVVVDITQFECRFMILYLKRACGANGNTKILRSDYGVGRYVPFVSDEVTLSFSVEAIKE